MNRFFDSVYQDLKSSLRKWRARPVFTLFVVATLALGIGVNVAVFSIVDVVLLRSLPYDSPERLVSVYTELVAQDGRFARSSGPEISDFRQRVPSLESLGGIWQRPAALTDESTTPEEVEMGLVTAGFLSTLGVSPLLGRDIAPEEDVPGAPPVIVLSYGLWQRRYGGDPAIVGKSVSMDGKSHLVVGVMPSDFSLWLPAEAGISPSLQAWVAWGGGYSEMSRAFRVFTVVGRLAPESSHDQARAEMDTLARRLVEEEPEAYARSGLELHLEPLHQEVTATARPIVSLIAAAVVLVLCIACANVANLLLVRAASLEREVRLRSALGASRARVMQQLVTEALALSTLGGVIGLILASWGLGLLEWLRPGELPRLAEVGIGVRASLFAVATTIVSGTGIGFLSAFHVSRPRASTSLRARSTPEGSGSRLRGALVVGELALSLALLVGAGLLVRTVYELSIAPLGFEARGVTTLKLSLIDYVYPYSDPEKIARFYRRLDESLEETGFFDSVGASTELPLDGGSGHQLSPYSFEINGEPIEWDTLTAHYATVTPGWFDSLGIPLLAGRRFDWTDDLDHPPVVIVDESLANRAWPGESAIGKRLRATFRRENGTAAPLWAEVVGVAGHIRYDPSLVGGAQIYLPHQQSPQRTMTLAIRAGLPVGRIDEIVRERVASLESAQPIHSTMRLEAYRDLAVAERRFAMLTLVFFAATALCLAAMGIYGLLAFMVRERTREIGIRLALGETPGGIRASVMGRGLRLIGLGTLLGLILAVAMSRMMTSLVFGIPPTDVLTFLAVAVFLVLVSSVACWIPGTRAATLNVSVALRED